MFYMAKDFPEFVKQLKARDIESLRFCLFHFIPRGQKENLQQRLEIPTGDFSNY